MKCIEFVVDGLNPKGIKELILKYTGRFSGDNTEIIIDLDDNIEVISNNKDVSFTFYGKEIMGKYHFTKMKQQNHINNRR